MKIKIVSVGSALRAIDRKGRVVVPSIPLTVSPPEAKRIIEEYLTSNPYPPDHRERERWVSGIFFG